MVSGEVSGEVSMAGFLLIARHARLLLFGELFLHLQSNEKQVCCDQCGRVWEVSVMEVSGGGERKGQQCMNCRLLFAGQAHLLLLGELLLDLGSELEVARLDSVLEASVEQRDLQERGKQWKR